MTTPLLRLMELQNRLQAPMLPCVGRVVGNRDKMPTFADLIESFSYKPGYEFTLVIAEPAIIDGFTMLADMCAATLYLKCVVPDSTKPPHEPYLLQFQAMIPAFVESQPREAQKHYLRMVLVEFEMHEMKEWFRVDGKLEEDPHG